MNDDELEAMLKSIPDGVTTQRVWKVRRAVLTHLPPHLPLWRMAFGPRPALLMATALFGLMMGVSLPEVLQGDAATTADVISPADPTGGFG